MATHQRRCTLEPVIEPDCETQPFAGRDRLGDVDSESSPIDAQSGVHEPAREPGQSAGRNVARRIADEPALSRIREHDDVESFQPEERSAAFVAIRLVVLPRVVAPVELQVPALHPISALCNPQSSTGETTSKARRPSPTGRTSPERSSLRNM